MCFLQNRQSTKFKYQPIFLAIRWFTVSSRLLNTHQLIESITSIHSLLVIPEIQGLQETIVPDYQEDYNLTEQPEPIQWLMVRCWVGFLRGKHQSNGKEQEKHHK